MLSSFVLRDKSKYGNPVLPCLLDLLCSLSYPYSGENLKCELCARVRSFAKFLILYCCTLKWESQWFLLSSAFVWMQVCLGQVVYLGVNQVKLSTCGFQVSFD